MAQLAVVGQIQQIEPITGADFIQAATVNCGEAGQWSGVVGKTLIPGDKVMVFLQDALLPANDPRWAFMDKHRWRVRMARFKGVPSECLILPNPPELPVGADIAEILGVTKYEKPVPASISGDTAGSFPSHIPKTDETNYQAARRFVNRMATEAWYASEKADGTSCTAWLDSEDQLHVCSRNWELKELTETGGENLYWKAARKYQLDRLPKGVALQFEVVGPGIQGNPMGLSDMEIRVFTLRDTVLNKDKSYKELRDLCNDLDLPPARFIAESGPNGIAMTDDQLRELADFKYTNGKPAEGVVIRSLTSEWSFKVINLKYKD